MNILNEVVDFRSSSEYFYDEKSGKKNNTMRKIDLLDDRFRLLLKAWKKGEYPKIRINLKGLARAGGEAINHLEDQMYSFMRYIQHIAVFEEWMIITWEHPTNKQDD